MSLWEKWEREKLERQGIKVERKDGVKILDTRPKPDVLKQSWILGGAILACLLVVYFALLLNHAYGGRWSEFYLVRVFAETAERRMESFRNQ